MRRILVHGDSNAAVKQFSKTADGSWRPSMASAPATLRSIHVPREATTAQRWLPWQARYSMKGRQYFQTRLPTSDIPHTRISKFYSFLLMPTFLSEPKPNVKGADQNLQADSPTRGATPQPIEDPG